MLDVALQPTAAIPMAALRQFMSQSLPVAAIGHSFHADLLLDPRYQCDPSLQQFSRIELNELHHQIAAMGALLRLQRGDQTAAASLGANLAGFLQNRQAALQVMPQISAQIQQDPRMQAMMRQVARSQQQVLQNLPVLSRAVMATTTTTPGVMMVGRC